MFHVLKKFILLSFFLYNQQQLNLFATCIIAARGIESKDAFGTFYDHYVFRKTGIVNTKVAALDEKNYNQKSFYEKALKTSTLNLPSCNLDEEIEQRAVPSISQSPNNEGLLIIPGRRRDAMNDSHRNELDDQLIKKALLHGQPILGICAGAWQVYKMCQSLCNIHDKCTIPVRDHANSKMISLSTINGKVTYNTEIHNIIVQQGSLLETIIAETKPIPVNSVHSEAVNEENFPAFLQVSARAIEDRTSTRENRHGNVMHPQEGIVEAFEVQYGVPVFGIQWHPEAYADLKDSFHKKIILFMYEAGKTYSVKQQALQELKARFTEKTFRK